MPDVIQCPSCGAQYRVADPSVVARAKCKKCGSAMAPPRVQADDDDDLYELSPAAAPSPKAKPTVVVRPAADERSDDLAPPRTRAASVTTFPSYAGAGVRARNEAEAVAASSGNGKKIAVGLLAGLLPLGLGIFLVTRVADRTAEHPNDVADRTRDERLTEQAAAQDAAALAGPVIRPSGGTWPLPSDAAPVAKAGMPARVKLARTDAAPAAVLFASRNTARAVVASPSKTNDQLWLDTYDLLRNTRTGAAPINVQFSRISRPIDVSPDGSIVLVTDNEMLHLYTLAPDGNTATRDREVFLMGVTQGSPWGAFVEKDLVIAALLQSGPTTLAAFKPTVPDPDQKKGWKAKQAKPIWSVRGILPEVQPRLSPGRRVVAYWINGGIVFADAATGKELATLPAADGRLGKGIAFDDAFTRAAVVWKDRFVTYLSVYDLKTGQPIGEYPGPETLAAPQQWVGPQHVLLEDGTVFDVNVGAPIWKYAYEDRVANRGPRPDARYWYVAQPASGPASLAAVTLPDPAALAAAKTVTPSLVPTKGLAVSVELSFAGPSVDTAATKQQIQTRLEQRLVAAGMVPTPGAPAKVTLAITARDTKLYRDFSGASGNRRVTLRNLVGAVEFTGATGGPPTKVFNFLVNDQSKMGMRIRGDDVEAFLLDLQWAEVEKRLINVSFPAYLPRSNGASAKPVGSSPLPAP